MIIEVVKMDDSQLSMLSKVSTSLCENDKVVFFTDSLIAAQYGFGL